MNTNIQNNLKAMAVFASVVETQSFTLAAKQLRVSKSSVSKDIHWLEQYLGVKLLHRTTRQVQITDVGLEYYRHCERIVTEVTSANDMIEKQQSEPTGLVKVLSPISFAHYQLIPIVNQLLSEYPQLQIDLELSDQDANLIAANFDVSIVVTNKPPESYVARKLMDIDWVFCASPTFLDQHSIPSDPKQLESYDCLTYRQRHPIHHSLLLKHTNKDPIEIKITSKFRCNTSTALLEAAIAGVGVAYLPKFIAKSAIERTELVPILEDWYLQPEAAYAIYQANHFMLPKVRVLVERLQKIGRE
ncbi:LysR family transcriptional regulator [Vibrio marisflavi]|uniref:HTH-type transcriptional regulator DmlR n=1 Tax=Vibrio marisflavi CECT 7928 TaxID=634439 RepID=A0ABM9A2Y4_9VIBR|nr:LysR family transcriptional regulator [Vibrio marisflavi]CAH0538970.1 HTH-type transcriptional regulator DmlR [Vibrio marisflavi CECT 7928]